ncbi:transposase [Streptomyces sp. AcE210]|uniref:MmyB family transcriptional regulator n=1 Tax=Streptomyces sp. AcE210 TaxID=2292703 RepID=UPI0023E758A0|nr:transposase [Streptomyces sp. AcE210]
MGSGRWDWIVPVGLREIAEPLLPVARVRPQGGGVANIDDEAVFAAIIYVLVSGCAWRALPPCFRQWWASHDVAHKTCGTKPLNHPVVGELTLDWEMLGCATDPDQQLMVMTAPPGSPAQESLRFLASWTGPENSPPQTPSTPASDQPGNAPRQR